MHAIDELLSNAFRAPKRFHALRPGPGTPPPTAAALDENRSASRAAARPTWPAAEWSDNRPATGPTSRSSRAPWREACPSEGAGAAKSYIAGLRKSSRGDQSRGYCSNHLNGVCRGRLLPNL